MMQQEPCQSFSLWRLAQSVDVEVADKPNLCLKRSMAVWTGIIGMFGGGFPAQSPMNHLCCSPAPVHVKFRIL